MRIKLRVKHAENANREIEGRERERERKKERKIESR